MLIAKQSSRTILCYNFGCCCVLIDIYERTNWVHISSVGSMLFDICNKNYLFAAHKLNREMLITVSYKALDPFLFLLHV